MKIKGLWIFAMICVVSLMLGGCLWPSATTKEKLDTSLVVVSSDNTACQAGDCNACKSAIAEANSTVQYVADNPGLSSSAAKAKLNKTAGITSEYYRRSQEPNSCGVSKTGSQKCYSILKWLRSYANGGEGSSE